MTIERATPKLPFALIGIWFVFTVSLTVWWIYFGLSLLNDIELIAGSSEDKLVKYHKMLLWEGATLVFFLFLGAITLVSLVMRERREKRRLRDFFAAFSHELKTPLASLKLHVDVLKEKAKGDELSDILKRLGQDTSRLTRQLENSLFIAGADIDLFIEEILLSDFIRSMREEWPRLEVLLKGDAHIKADTRALSSVLGNLFSNAVEHGKAKKLYLTVNRIGDGEVRIEVRDEGGGFQGDAEQLGTPFIRHSSKSGSGIGLYIVRTLMRRMEGDVGFRSDGTGFSVHLTFKGSSI